MRSSTIATLLCAIVILHNVAGQGFIGPKWRKVFPYGFYPVWSARMVVQGTLGLPWWSYWLYMDWALGGWYNKWFKRFTRYRVWFRIQLKKNPKIWYRCYGFVAWPKFGQPYLVGGPFFNRCWKM